ncbi:hypothetical protein EV182_007423, partial [Spiromyces aspiralis]
PQASSRSNNITTATVTANANAPTTAAQAVMGGLGSTQNTTGQAKGEQFDHGRKFHPLRYTWTFWFLYRLPGQKITDYEAAMTEIASFSSIEDFWSVYSHISYPYEVPTISDYHLFKRGIRPMWE